MIESTGKLCYQIESAHYDQLAIGSNCAASFGNSYSLKGGVGNFGETNLSALEFENTQPEEICYFLTEPLLQHT